jgi:hypothetical protein
MERLRTTPRSAAHSARGLWVLTTFLAVVTLGSVTATPAAFGQTNPEKSLQFAQQGAQHFGEKHYLQAARSFESAYRLNPSDPLYLRYSGRGWQEVGHWERARQLLERYYTLEKDPNRKATILKHLGRLRGATPLVIAERLRFATETYPGQGLELDAGFAFEKLGELECKKGNGDGGVKALRQGKQFFEVARLSARTAGERTEISTGIKRAEGKIDKCKPFCAEKLDGPWCADDRTLIVCVGRKAKKTTRCDSRCTSGGPGQPGKCLAPVKLGPGPAGPGPPPPPPSGGVAKYIIGGVLLVAGGGLAGFGYLQASDANTEAEKDITRIKEGKEPHFQDADGYNAARSTADLLHYAGIGAAVVGVGVVGWAIASGGGDAPAKKATWFAPAVAKDSFGLSFGGRF